MAGIFGHFQIQKNKDQQNIDKCNYLRSQLMGQGSEMLIRIKLSNDNYNNAAAILKKHDGKNQAMIDSHYAPTNNIPVVSYKTASLCQFYKCTEKHMYCHHQVKAITRIMYSP